MYGGSGGGVAEDAAGRAAGSGPAPPRVRQQKGSIVTVSNGAALEVGTWVRTGPHVGVVSRHEESCAIVHLFCEQRDRGFEPLRSAVRVGTLVEKLGPETWASLQEWAVGEGAVPVGWLRQAGLRIPAKVRRLHRARMLVVGTPGSGKSTALTAMMTAWRNEVDAAAAPAGARRPSLIVFDAHGDAVGDVVDDGESIRPSLATTLKVRPVVLGPGDLVFRGRDVPTTILVRALGALSPIQKNWRDIYASDDGDPSGVESLLRRPAEDQSLEDMWADAFAHLGRQGSLSKSVVDALHNLKRRLKALLTPPLFSSTGKSTWDGFFAHVREGRTVIINARHFGVRQQSLLVHLIVSALMKARMKEMAERMPLQKIVFAIDETHELEGVDEVLEKFFRNCRKMHFGMILGSQKLSDWPDAVITSATDVVVLRSHKTDFERVAKVFDELRAVREEFALMRPGQAIVAGGGIPWPVQFVEPRMVRRAVRRGA